MDKNQEYIKDVVTLKLDQDKCTGCGMCMNVCPHKVFEIQNLPRRGLGKAGKKAVIIDKDACMECGACEKNCPTKAISVESGVGCAAAVITGMLKGTAPTCDCSGESGHCCG